MNYIDRMRFEAIGDSYLEPREPQIIGRCDVCGWPVYSGDKYEYTHNGLRHITCPPEEKE